MIYLDYHAAAPPSREAVDAMQTARGASWANPSSVHQAGRASRALLEEARASIAAAIGAQPVDVILTSGGTEACNLGVGLAKKGGHLVATTVEHPAIAAALAGLAEPGKRLTYLACERGVPPPAEALKDALREDTSLVAVQWVNHEVGTIFPIAEYASVCEKHGVDFLVDATQALGKIPISMELPGVTALALASHKMGGPAGAGALWVRRTAKHLPPLLVGGAQEKGRRAGSPDVHSIVGFGAACRHLGARLQAMQRLHALRDRLEQFLVHLGASVNGEGPRVATVTNVSLPTWPGKELVIALDLEGVCVSSGAACSSGLAQPSATVRAMYEAENWRATHAIRFSLGPETTAEEVDEAERILLRVLSRRRAG